MSGQERSRSETQSETVAKIIRERIAFHWQGDQTWAGLSQADLCELTVSVSNYLGITKAQAARTRVVFADHDAENIDGQTHFNTATCYVTSNSQDKIRRCRVVINRSREILQHRFRTYEKRRSNQSQNYCGSGVIAEKSTHPALECWFVSPLEQVTWILAEELHHARVNFIAGSTSVLATWEDNYLAYLREKGLVFRLPYAVDLLEVAASRVALRTLAHLSASPERRHYFYVLYLASLELTSHVVPIVYEKAFVDTGFEVPVS